MAYEIIGESWDGSQHICGLRLLNKLRKKEITVKIEIWIDISDKVKSDAYETMDEQTEILANMKEKFVANLSESLDMKSALVREVTKFEYHESSHSKLHSHKGHGGGRHSRGGGYAERSYNFRGRRF